MNKLLQVKMPFNNLGNDRPIGAKNIRSNATVSFDHIEQLIRDLERVKEYYYSKHDLIEGIIIDVNYKDIIAKSSRISELLKPEGKDINSTIVGARFSDAPEGEENHIITHYVEAENIDSTIKKLRIVKEFINAKLSGEATAKNFNEIWDVDKKKRIVPFEKEEYEAFGLKKSPLRNTIVDCSMVNSFSVPNIRAEEKRGDYLITFFNTGVSLDTIFERMGIESNRHIISRYGDDTISVREDLYGKLIEEVPFLISMISADLSKIILDDIPGNDKPKMDYIPSPTSEPVIGVIDTLFNDSVYFHEWVENIDKIEDFEKTMIRDEHKVHGTEVTSIVVDGPSLNPWLDDGCGRFRVRHFGVCLNKISVIRLVRKIKDIVNENPDIHVWNLSLGTEDEVSRNYISFDAAVLDEIQANKNVIFVVSGTNDNRKEKRGKIRIGSPADSLNSIVVNAVDREGRETTYSRQGKVLSFFNKPDVSYYGGDVNERMSVYSPTGIEQVYGTSFAAPWISRKLCYLIDVIGLPREVAKALIIDSAARWSYKTETQKNHNLLGYGVVPIDIMKILYTGNEEIKFTVYGTSQSYRTINNYIPVPKDSDEKYPYIARATLCYFPKCTRAQGVDYTNRELSIKFGRVKDDGTIEDINENIQDDKTHFSDERKSRNEFRKWENTKFISKILRRNQSLKAYTSREWGFSITSKERLGSQMEESLNFGAVVTLREINGVNRINEFISACTMRGWIVNEINVEKRVELYNENQEEIVLE